jgi:hypothetical protein
MGEQGSAARRAELSYTSATSDTPLLGDTIGANFDRTVAMFPARLALVDVPAGLRYTYAELKAEVDALTLHLPVRRPHDVHRRAGRPWHRRV